MIVSSAVFTSIMWVSNVKLWLQTDVSSNESSWTMRPLDDASLGRYVPWTMRPLDDASTLLWKMRLLDDATLTVQQILIYVFPGMKLRGLVRNSYIHVSVCDLYISKIGLSIGLQPKSWEIG